MRQTEISKEVAQIEAKIADKWLMWIYIEGRSKMMYSSTGIELRKRTANENDSKTSDLSRWGTLVLDGAGDDYVGGSQEGRRSSVFEVLEMSGIWKFSFAYVISSSSLSICDPRYV